jgi:ribosomal protein S18 acetylase RimI-like enzyme
MKHRRRFATMPDHDTGAHQAAGATPQVTVRPATPVDRDPVGALWEGAGFPPLTNEEWKALYDVDTTTILVALVEDRPVGAAVASWDGWRAYIYHVAVEPAMRHHGIARALMTEAERSLATAGARYVFAEAHPDNTEGLALLGGLDYLPEGEIVLTKRLPIQL